MVAIYWFSSITNGNSKFNGLLSYFSIIQMYYFTSKQLLLDRYSRFVLCNGKIFIVTFHKQEYAIVCHYTYTNFKHIYPIILLSDFHTIYNI